MKIKTLAVIIQTNNDEVYQVALDNKMLEHLANHLTNYFKEGGIIKITNKLEGITINNLEKKEKQFNSIMKQAVTQYIKDHADELPDFLR